MGFFKNLVSQDLVQDRYKKAWAESIYNTTVVVGFKELTFKYAINLDQEFHQLLPEIKAGTDIMSIDNPVMREIAGKVLIEQMIENIFQSAKKDDARIKARGDNGWHTPIGLAQGAANLLKQTDTHEKKLFVYMIALMVVKMSFDIPALLVRNGIILALEENNWTEEEIRDVLSFKGLK